VGHLVPRVPVFLQMIPGRPQPCEIWSLHRPSGARGGLGDELELDILGQVQSKAPARGLGCASGDRALISDVPGLLAAVLPSVRVRETSETRRAGGQPTWARHGSLWPSTNA
jgi:hypothetical protein